MSHMATETRTIWRAIRDAGPAGMTPAAVRALLPHLPGRHVGFRLNALQSLDYLVYVGASQRGSWHVGNRAPVGESFEVGAPTCRSALASHGESSPRRRPLCRQAMPAVPRSIWHLAEMCAGDS